MSLAKLKKKYSGRVIGVDASTNSFAFCVIDQDKIIKYGEIFFEGSDIYERILDAKNKMGALKKEKFFDDIDFMAIEAAVSVKSVHTGIKMAYVFGAIMGEILSKNIKVVEIHPLTWQSFIGNNNFTKEQKQEVKKQFPGKSENWYKAKIREIRKGKTNEFARSKGVRTSSDNVSDALGIGWYFSHSLMENK